MRFAYADPPYVGEAKRRYGSDAREVNLPLLINYLERDFDGWALSCKSNSLRDVLPICPEKVRVLAWVKPWGAWRANVQPAYLWEPVILRPFERRRELFHVPHLYDWTSAPATTRRGVVGAKPEAFSWWLFACADLREDDEFVDIFPGSGGVARAWEIWNRQPRLLSRKQPHRRIAKTTEMAL